MSIKVQFTKEPVIMTDHEPSTSVAPARTADGHRVFRVRDAERACYDPDAYGSGFVESNTKPMLLRAPTDWTITSVGLRHSTWHQMVSMICFYFMDDAPEVISDDPKNWKDHRLSGLGISPSFEGLILPAGVSKLADDIKSLREDGTEQEFISVLTAMPGVLGSLYPRLSEGILRTADQNGAMAII